MKIIFICFIMPSQNGKGQNTAITNEQKDMYMPGASAQKKIMLTEVDQLVNAMMTYGPKGDEILFKIP